MSFHVKKEINTDLRAMKASIMHVRAALETLDEVVDNLYYNVNVFPFNEKTLMPDDYFKCISEDLK